MRVLAYGTGIGGGIMVQHILQWRWSIDNEFKG